MGWDLQDWTTRMCIASIMTHLRPIMDTSNYSCICGQQSSAELICCSVCKSNKAHRHCVQVHFISFLWLVAWTLCLPLLLDQNLHADRHLLRALCRRPLHRSFSPSGDLHNRWRNQEESEHGENEYVVLMSGNIKRRRLSDQLVECIDIGEQLPHRRRWIESMFEKDESDWL